MILLWICRIFCLHLFSRSMDQKGWIFFFLAMMKISCTLWVYFSVSKQQSQVFWFLSVSPTPCPNPKKKMYLCEKKILSFLFITSTNQAKYNKIFHWTWYFLFLRKGMEGKEVEKERVMFLNFLFLVSPLLNTFYKVWSSFSTQTRSK